MWMPLPPDVFGHPWRRARRAPRGRCGRRVGRRRTSPRASGRDRCATRRVAPRRSAVSSTGGTRPSTSARPRRHRRGAGHTARRPCGSIGGSARAPSHPLRGALGQALLVDLLAGDAGGEAVQHARSVTQRADDAVGDGEVVAGQVELRLAARREVHALGVGQPHRAIADVELDGRAGLRPSSPSSHTAGRRVARDAHGGLPVVGCQMSQFVDEAQLNVRGGDGGAGLRLVPARGARRQGRTERRRRRQGRRRVARRRPQRRLAARVPRPSAPPRRQRRPRQGQGHARPRRRRRDRRRPRGHRRRATSTRGEVLAELWNHGDRWRAAAGGRGGRGNARFLTNRRRAPTFAEQGEHGEERWLKLELQLMADVALVGFPNVGKSTLISVISAAKPKIADYPFTTLEPNLGVVRVDDDTEFVVADIPGLIEGASEGKGLGHRFLRHVERARVLCLLVDLAALDGVPPGRAGARAARRARRRTGPTARPAAARRRHQGRPRRRRRRLRRRRRDALGDLGRHRRRRAPPRRGDGGGGARGARAGAAGGRASCCCARRRPARWSSASAITSSACSGRDVERVVALNDVTTHEATAYISHRLDRLGVHRQLARAGAADGDVVWIGDFSFEYRDE